MYLLADFERRVMAYKLACTIRPASWLGKHAAIGRSRALAYAVKPEKISTVLLSFADHFRLLQAEHHPHHGVLILVALPNRRSAHVPLGSLTLETQARVNGVSSRCS